MARGGASNRKQCHLRLSFEGRVTQQARALWAERTGVNKDAEVSNMVFGTGRAM